MTLSTILIIVWLHFFSDFILQSDRMGKGKSSSEWILFQHVFLYTLPFLFFGPVYALVNGVAHYVTDWISSRLTTYLWKREQRHWFFVTIGADQAIHMTTLFATYVYLFGTK